MSDNDSFLPPYVPVGQPTPQVTPLTYRDGVTMLKKLDDLKKYINRILVPWVEENYAELALAFNTTAQALIAAVNAAIDSVINDSIEVQDPVVAGLLEDDDSLTRVALDVLLAGVIVEKPADVGVFDIPTDDSAFEPVGVNSTSDFPARVEAKLAEKFPAKNSVYTKTEADNKFETKTDATTAHDGLEADINGVSGRVTTLETLTTTGRLSQTQLDDRYLEDAKLTHAVMIGTSNSVPATLWPGNWAAKAGLTIHNYSVGGGGFTAAPGASKFSYQLDAAIADTSFDKTKVKFFIIGDSGNDVRGEADCSAEAAAVYQKARQNYPQARIIHIPALWGRSTDNLFSNRIASILRRWQEFSDAGAQYNVELVPFSWTWHFDKTAWMDGDTVHYTAAGYDRVQHFFERYLLNAPTDSPIGWKLGTPQSGINPWGDYMYVRNSRIGNTGRLAGTFRVPSAGLPVDTNIAIMQVGANPFEAITFNAVALTPRTTKTFQLYPDGTFRCYEALPAVGGGANWETYSVNVDYSVF